MMDVAQLKRYAASIRLHTVKSVYLSQSGHPGGSLSCVDILAVLYGNVMRINPARPDWPERDRFVLSKGHAAPSYYAALALRGYFPVEELDRLRSAESFLQGHPCKNKVPGVDFSSGSLGQGLSGANGMAMAAKADKIPLRVYCVVGDGEMQEGQIWEALMTSAHYALDNLTLFVDNNGLQIDGGIAQVMNVNPIPEKLRAFGWNVIECDGHSFESLLAAIKLAQAHSGSPSAIVCKTVKGKGVSFMENQVSWHGSAPNAGQYAQAEAELKEELKK